VTWFALLAYQPAWLGVKPTRVCHADLYSRNDCTAGIAHGANKSPVVLCAYRTVSMENQATKSLDMFCPFVRWSA
jgi:hypothetical protein